jgi:hypothetical protein
MPVILAIGEAEICRIVVLSQSGETAHDTPILTNSWVQWYMPVMLKLSRTLRLRGSQF